MFRALFIGALMLAGCREPKVVVVLDESGAPIAGAAVEIQAASFSGPKAVTDSVGRAEVDASILGAKFINASKDGYDSGGAALPVTWPVEIRLKRRVPRA